MSTAGKTSSGRALTRAFQAPSLALALAASAIALGANPARAQLAVDRVDLTLDPTVAAQHIGTFTVKNNGTVVAQATVSLSDWDRNDVGENRFFRAGQGPGSCGAALTVTPASVRLAPGESQEIRVALDGSAAKALSARECWSIAFVETSLPPTNAGDRVANYVVRTGVKLYVAGSALKPDAEITTMHIAKDDLSLVVQNTGSRHTVAHGAIEFRRSDNTLAAKIDVPDLYMLPGASIRTTLTAPKLPAGKYIVLGVIDYRGPDLAAAQLEYEVP